jgi:hypothetical protein
MKMRQSSPDNARSGDATGWQAAMRAALDRDAAPLPPDDVQAMRRTVIAATRATRPVAGWGRPLAIAATVCLMIGLGAAAGWRFESSHAPARVSSGEIAPAAAEQLQLQFATPGGTRIIWVFNSDLDLKATMP